MFLCELKFSRKITRDNMGFWDSERIEIIFFVCRALLVYCLRHYKGDDKIKSFIWDLISPTKEGQDQTLLNHSG